MEENRKEIWENLMNVMKNIPKEKLEKDESFSIQQVKHTRNDEYLIDKDGTYILLE